jgi:ADP-ribosylation factor family
MISHPLRNLANLSAASPCNRVIVYLLRPPHKDAVYTAKSTSQGQGDAHLDAVRQLLTLSSSQAANVCCVGSGLDNAGKTTIVKSIMNEEVTSVSPTLGFIIRTVEFEGLPICLRQVLSVADKGSATN